RPILLVGGALSASAAVAQLTGMPPASVRPGSWNYAATATGSEASFMDPSGTVQLAIRCTRATRIVGISMRAVPATSLSVSTSSLSRSLPAAFDAASARVNAQLPARDGLLDAIAFSQGRFSVSVTGLSPLVLPAWPEPARAIEDCRN
ncbi:MAG: hypothetical protein ACJ8EY_05010, partial [Sphingomicrobium sp.]